MTIDYDKPEEDEDFNLLVSASQRHERAIRAVSYDLTRKIVAAERLIESFNAAGNEAFNGELHILEIAPCDDDLVVTFDYTAVPEGDLPRILYTFRQCHAEGGLLEGIYFCQTWVHDEELHTAQFIVHHHKDRARAKTCQMILEMSMD